MIQSRYSMDFYITNKIQQSFLDTFNIVNPLISNDLLLYPPLSTAVIHRTPYRTIISRLQPRKQPQ